MQVQCSAMDETTLIPLQPTGVMQGRIVVLEPDGPGKVFCELVESAPNAVARVKAKMDAAIQLKEEGIVVKQIQSLWEPGARNQLCARSLLFPFSPFFPCCPLIFGVQLRQHPLPPRLVHESRKADMVCTQMNAGGPR
jgi:hypothetical protein